jgi:hypothetical protein
MNARNPFFSANGQRAMQMLMDAGYSRAAAAAMVGNLVQESGAALNPTLQHDYDAKQGRFTGIGIAGFRDPNPGRGRMTNLVNFAKANNASHLDFDTQMRYLIHELDTSEKAIGQRLRNASDPSEANRIAIGFFRPRGYSASNPQGGHGFENRARNTQALYRASANMPDSQYASNTSASPDNAIDFDSMVRSAPQYRTVYNGEDPTGQEGYALSGTGRTTEYASDPRQITANEDQSGQEGYSLSGAGRVENPPLDYLKERQSRLYPPFGGDPNRPPPGRGAPPPPSGPPTFQQQAQAFDPNSIDQQGWINPQHGRMMAYNHAVQTGNTRVAEALVNPSTMQTYLNPTGIAHGFSSAVLDRASGEIDAMREEEEHKKSSAQGAASFFGSLFR